MLRGLAFFKENNFLVGISLDGPQLLHDVYRTDGNNQGSFDDAIRGWHYLKKSVTKYKSAPMRLDKACYLQ